MALQKRQWKRRPPSMNCINGHMYALHRLHLTGPISPMLTMGGKYSSSNVRAKGLTTIPNGTAVWNKTKSLKEVRPSQNTALPNFCSPDITGSASHYGLTL